MFAVLSAIFLGMVVGGQAGGGSLAGSQWAVGSGQVGDDERSFGIEYDDSRKRYECEVSKETK